ncbi:hypothetical protein GCM10011384_03450 [Psychrobacillus lasiicapitis]|nr:hypothetical protein GCM10011384_03450 [Psychrobacillus lasiicapitis]
MDDGPNLLIKELILLVDINGARSTNLKPNNKRAYVSTPKAILRIK